MLPGELTGDLKKRLSTVKGQIEAIVKMLDEETDPDKILIYCQCICRCCFQVCSTYLAKKKHSNCQWSCPVVCLLLLCKGVY
jgi:hypothetical protein